MKLDRKRIILIAGILGAVLGVVCPHLPEDYRPICTAVATLATSC